MKTEGVIDPMLYRSADGELFRLERVRDEDLKLLKGLPEVRWDQISPYQASASERPDDAVTRPPLLVTEGQTGDVFEVLEFYGEPEFVGERIKSPSDLPLVLRTLPRGLYLQKTPVEGGIVLVLQQAEFPDA